METKHLKTAEIAARIDTHLKHFEADKRINKTDPKRGSSRFYHAHAWSSGRWVGITYISYQGASNLTKGDAERYLRWLNSGNIGRHYEALKP